MKKRLLLRVPLSVKNFVAAIILMAPFFAAKDLRAQISYHDIVPDEVLSTWSSYPMGIDSSASGGLIIWNDFGTQIDVNSYDTTCQVMENASYPSALNAGDVIGPSGTWRTPNYSLLNNGTVGHWKGVTNKYLGVKVLKGGQWEYGWIRMDVDTAGTSVTIKDYGCNKSADSSILAGQMVGTGVNGVAGNSQTFEIYPNPSKSGILQFTSGSGFTSCTIYSMSGQELKNLNISSAHSIDISALANGLYIVEMSSPDFIYRKMVTLER